MENFINFELITAFMAGEIYALRDKLLTQVQVLDGVNEIAREQNQRVIQALSYAGGVLNTKYPNDVFGLLLKGSRIKGYHTTESDADLIVISPEGSSNQDNIFDILVEAKKRYGVEEVKLDQAAQMWDVYIKLDDFLSQCDQEPAFFNSIIGYEISSNPNLLMARLTALKVMSGWNGQFNLEYAPNWDYVQERYNEDYLGEREHVNKKVAERFGVSIQDVNKVLNHSLWRERHDKFTLPAWENLFSKYESEFKRLRGRGKFVMYDIYKKVIEDLKSGF